MLDHLYDHNGTIETIAMLFDDSLRSQPLNLVYLKQLVFAYSHYRDRLVDVGILAILEKRMVKEVADIEGRIHAGRGIADRNIDSITILNMFMSDFSNCTGHIIRKRICSDDGGIRLGALMSLLKALLNDNMVAKFKQINRPLCWLILHLYSKNDYLGTIEDAVHAHGVDESKFSALVDLTFASEYFAT